MKKQLTKEQSQRLIELGVHRISTIGDLLELLPGYIGLEVRNKYGVERGTLCCDLTITSKYIVSYECTILDHKAKETIVEFSDSNLIDSLYCMVIWCIENGYIKTDKK